MQNSVRYKAVAIALNRSTHYALAALIFGCLISYIYFANLAVRNVTLLEKTKKDMQSLSVEVSELESTRLLLNNKVNAEMARALGFVEVSHQTFIINKSGASALSLKTP